MALWLLQRSRGRFSLGMWPNCTEYILPCSSLLILSILPYHRASCSCKLFNYYLPNIRSEEFSISFPGPIASRPQQIDDDPWPSDWLINGYGNGIQLDPKRMTVKEEEALAMMPSEENAVEFGQPTNLGTRCWRQVFLPFHQPETIILNLGRQGPPVWWCSGIPAMSTNDDWYPEFGSYELFGLYRIKCTLSRAICLPEEFAVGNSGNGTYSTRIEKVKGEFAFI